MSRCVAVSGCLPSERVRRSSSTARRVPGARLMLLRSDVFLTLISRRVTVRAGPRSENLEGPLRDDAPEVALAGQGQLFANRAFAEALHERDHAEVGARCGDGHVLELGLGRAPRLD